MALVTGNLDAVVLDNILLDNSVSILALYLGLLECFLIEIAFWNEAIVAWNMGRHLCSSHSQLMSLITLSGCIVRQLVTGVLTIGAY